MKAIIAGTGIDRVVTDLVRKSVGTQFGQVDYCLRDDLVIIPRHGFGHEVAPARVNYKANVKALEALGVDRVIGIYAVGSITSRLSPGAFGLVEDFLDFTGRDVTFFDGVEAPLRHTGMVDTFDRTLMADFAKAAYRAGERDIKSGIVYVTTNGPRFETPAEIRAFRNLGADVVGMTLATEAALIHELAIPYAALAYSINWAAGLDEEGLSFLEDESIDRLSRRILSLSADALTAGR